jgi:ABC-type antimicrobial peptide transport system permease subunit
MKRRRLLTLATALAGGSWLPPAPAQPGPLRRRIPRTGEAIGAIGLGIVLLRNLHERRRELALLLAIGYRRTQLYWIVFLENFLLLALGWSIGMLSALIGVLPSLISPAFDLQGGTIVLLTAGILVNGLLWIVLPLRAALRKPLIPVLRNE